MIKSILFGATILILSYGSLSCQKENNYTTYFNIVWNTINDKFYDPNFEGNNWNTIKQEYEPLISDAQSDSVFYDLINRMLFELGVSHIGVIPPGSWSKVEPTTFAVGSTGIDIRFLNNNAVITSVMKNSPADSAGIKTSYILVDIDGKSVNEIANERINFLEPPFNKNHSITAEIQSYLFGDAGTLVNLNYQDNDAIEHTAHIRRMIREKIITLGS